MARKGAKDSIIYRIEESKIGASWQAVCPELLIIGFGDTADEAKDSLRRQVSEYLEDCDDLGVLDEVLIDAGVLLRRRPLDQQRSEAGQGAGHSYPLSPSPLKRYG